MQEENRQKIIELRHVLHRYPELSMQEAETAERLMAFLRANTDLDVVPQKGWFYALKQGRPGGRKIAFRADMDALPIREDLPLPYTSCRDGVSHKCGHDGHSAALCGLALELSGRKTDNTVYLIFQPGEETGQGARICRKLLQRESIDEIYAFHNLPGYPEGRIVCREGLTQPASEGLRIKLEGKTSHASAPEKGRNPAEVLAKTVLYARELDRMPSEGMRLCTITGLTLGNGDFGISPGEGEISLTLRAEKEEEMDRLEQAVLSFAEEQAAQAGLKMTSGISDRFPETRNHASCLKRARAAAKVLGISLAPMDSLWRASEDFGEYLKVCPGAMVYIGTGENWPALHTKEYDFNDRILETAVDLFAELARGRDNG